MKPRYLFTFLVLSMLSACAGSKDHKSNNSEQNHRIQEQNKAELKAAQCKPIQSSFFEDKMPKSMGKYEVSKMEQVGECLVVTVNHNGRSSLRDFHLLWNGAVMKSLPPIAVLKLEGSIRDEGGESTTQEFHFNLDALKTFGNVIKIRLAEREVDMVEFRFE